MRASMVLVPVQASRLRWACTETASGHCCATHDLHALVDVCAAGLVEHLARVRVEPAPGQVVLQCRVWGCSNQNMDMLTAAKLPCDVSADETLANTLRGLWGPCMHTRCAKLHAPATCIMMMMFSSGTPPRFRIW